MIWLLPWCIWPTTCSSPPCSAAKRTLPCCYDRIQEIKKGLPLPDETTPQEKIVGEYSGAMTRLIKKAVMPEFFTDRARLCGLESDTRTQLKQTAAQWMADLETKRQECQSLIDHLDYIATHPNS